MGVADDINNTSGITGVQKRGNKWAANIVVKGRFCWLGSYKNIEDAVKIRKEAEKHVETGDFTEWFKNYPFDGRKRPNNTSGVTGIQKIGNNWVAQIRIEGNNYWLGSYKNIEDATKIRKEAEEHLKTGDFTEWFSSTRKRVNNTSGITGVQKIRNSWWAQIGVKGKNYWLGSYKNKDDAVKIRKEAEKHVETGDFIEWFENFSGGRKRR
ncbi:MAG: hypothetical protein K1W39_14745 [Lachnospiraceae bacterium]|jgi:hypothetical protein